MPNEKKHALRYLLLRFLWAYREVVPENLYQEVAKTLTVGETDKGFVVKWMRQGNEFQKRYRKDDFKFFVRGDNIKQSKPSYVDHKHNTKVALEFVKQAMDLNGIIDCKKSEPLFPRTLLYLFLYGTFAAIIYLAGGEDFILAAITIFVLFAIEFWYQKGKILVSPLIGVFIPIGLPYTAIIASFFYFLIQILDPNKNWRGLRLFFSIAVLGYALIFVISYEILPLYDQWLIFITVIAIVSFLMCWTCGSHFRSFPLVFPFLCIGMYLDAQILPSIAGLTCSILTAFLSNKDFYFFPVQKERSLIPNG